jgi:thiamine kinase-like enzyme/dTDP-glucose pyrophosphorylase
MTNTVIIPTAGLGSRMGNYTRDLNKALLPYQDKPVLAHIIDNFPRDTKFIIPVGYLSDQIRQFCGQAYPDRDITFVTVEDYTSAKSGTATTLLACEPLIHGAFWYVPCDTYFNECVHGVSYDENVYFTRLVRAADTKLYTIFELDTTNRIQNVVFKQQYATEQAAFTGLMYVDDWAKFFNQLNANESNEFIDIIAATSKTQALDSWLDFGCPQIYQTELSKSRTFDFTKKDELTYICNNRVVKWWLDGTIAEKKYNKVLANPTVFPDNCTFEGNYMAYDYFEGQTLYEFNRVDKFDSLLTWLDKEVWHKTTDNITQASSEFYKTKSLQRINKFLAMNPNLQTINFVDNVPVKHYSFYLNRIDWAQLSQVTQSGFMHGDLQFDNIVIDSTYNFKLIDWRHEFAGLVTIGDIYYDLAKMMGGLIINYARIKQHNFDIQILDDAVTLSIPSVDNIDQYRQQLESYVVKNNLELNKVRTLVPIIFWNMAPLHTAPFDQFLWYLGIKLFAEMDL